MATGLKQESQVFAGVRPELLKALTPEQQEAVKFLPEKYQKALDTLLGRQKEVADGRRLWRAEDPSSIKARIDGILEVAKASKVKAEEVKPQARGEEPATEEPKVLKAQNAKQEFSVFAGIRPVLLDMLTLGQREDVKFLSKTYQGALDSLLGRKKEIQDGRKLWPAEDPKSIDSRISSILATAKDARAKADAVKAEARVEGDQPAITAPSTLGEVSGTAPNA